jgi:hypothetical protein
MTFNYQSIYDDDNIFDIITLYGKNFLNLLSYEQKKSGASYKVEKNDTMYESPIGTMLQCCRNYSEINNILQKSNLTQQELIMKENILRNFQIMSSVALKLLEQNDALKNLKLHLYRGITNQVKEGDLFGNRISSFTLNPRMALSFSQCEVGVNGTVIHLYCELNKFMIPIMRNCRNRTLQFYSTDAFNDENEILFLPEIVITINNIELYNSMIINTPYNYWYYYVLNIEPFLDIIFNKLRNNKKNINYIDYLKTIRFDWQLDDENCFTYLLNIIKTYLPQLKSNGTQYNDDDVINLLPPAQYSISIESMKQFLYNALTIENLTVKGDRMHINNISTHIANATMSIAMLGGNSYNYKYLKYKKKYLQLKNEK